MFQAPDDPMVKMNWEINGSYTTLSGLEALDEQTRIELVDWVINLPFGAVTKVNDRFYIMVHAGIRPTGSLPQDQLTSQGVKDLLLSPPLARTEGPGWRSRAESRHHPEHRRRPPGG